MRSSQTTSLFISALVWLIVVVAMLMLFRTLIEKQTFIIPESTKFDPLANSLKNRILIYSTHALERMWERNISFSEVEYVKENGAVNWAKSKKENVYALEAKTPGNRDIRVVFSPYFRWFATVVTAFPLGA